MENLIFRTSRKEEQSEFKFSNRWRERKRKRSRGSDFQAHILHLLNRRHSGFCKLDRLVGISATKLCFEEPRISTASPLGPCVLVFLGVQGRKLYQAELPRVNLNSNWCINNYRAFSGKDDEIVVRIQTLSAVEA